MSPAARRPRGVTALAVFFGAGATIAAVSCASLLTPGGPLEPMWRMNPRAREAFGRLGPASVPLMAAVAVACALASVGLARHRRWGHRLAVVLLVTNLAGDAANVALGVEPRAAFGIPIVTLILFYLARPRVRSSFAGRGGEATLPGASTLDADPGIPGEVCRRVAEIFEGERIERLLPTARDRRSRVEAMIPTGSTLAQAHGTWLPEYLATLPGLPPLAQQPPDALTPEGIARVVCDCIEEKSGGMSSHFGYRGRFVSLLVSIPRGCVWDVRVDVAS